MPIRAVIRHMTGTVIREFTVRCEPQNKDRPIIETIDLNVGDRVTVRGSNGAMISSFESRMKDLFGVASRRSSGMYRWTESVPPPSQRYVGNRHWRELFGRAIYFRHLRQPCLTASLKASSSASILAMTRRSFSVGSRSESMTRITFMSSP